MRLGGKIWCARGRWALGTMRGPVFGFLICWLPAAAQAYYQRPGSPEGHAATLAAAEAELQLGIALNRQAKFNEALLHLKQARGTVKETYVVEFNLGLAYLGTANYDESIRVLQVLHQNGGNTEAVNNLLAQAYLGQGKLEPAFKAFTEAAHQAPRDEKLYAYIADACTDHHQYIPGLRVVEVGLKSLPGSARLHYERAVFLAQLDRFNEGRPEFQKAAVLAPGTDIAYLAEVQEALYDNQLAKASQIARDGIRAGHDDYQMLGLLGTVLLRNGAVPGSPEFNEAKSVLQESVTANPDFSSSQLALGKAYLMEREFDHAIEHLKIAERIEPLNPAVYPSLASAYRGIGDTAGARECTSRLGSLLQEKATPQ